MPSQYDPTQHHRRSIRLKGYDYSSAGSYFITICAHQRQCLFGEIVDGQMQLNEMGQCVRSVWMNLPRHFRSLELDEFVVMPNHFHGILSLRATDGRGEAFASRSGTYDDNPRANASPLRGDQPSSPRDGSPHQGDQPSSPRDGSPHQGDQPSSPRDGSPHQGDQASSQRKNGTQSQSIAAIIQNFKSVSTRKINRMHQSSGRTIWQRNYYEHIIQDDRALQNIRRYIQSNPLAWQEDRLYADRASNP